MKYTIRNLSLSCWLILTLLLLSPTLVLNVASAQTFIKKGNPNSRSVPLLITNATNGANVTGLTGAAVGTAVQITQNTSSGSTSVGATSLVLTSAAGFPTSGSVWVPSQAAQITYTGISTNTLTGIPASGAGSVTATIPTASVVTTGVAGSVTVRWTPNSGAMRGYPLLGSGSIIEFANGEYEYVPSATESNTTSDVHYIFSSTGNYDYNATATFQTYKIDDIGEALVAGNGSVNDGSATATSFITTLSGPTDFCKGQMLVFTSSSSLPKQSAIVYSFNTSTKVVTFLSGSAFTSAPANTDTFYLTPGPGKRIVDMLAALGTDDRPKISANTHTSGATTTVGSYAAGQEPEVRTLNATASSYNVALSIGAKINAAGAGGDPLGNPTTAYAAPGTIGYNIAQYLTGNAFTRLGAPIGGVSISADLSSVSSTLGGLNTNFNTFNTLFGTRIPGVLSVTGIAANILATPGNLLATNGSGQVQISNVPANFSLLGINGTGQFTNTTLALAPTGGGTAFSNNQVSALDRLFALTNSSNQFTAGAFTLFPFPSDYLSAGQNTKLTAASTAQQAGSPVTLPTTAPTGYGAGVTGAGVYYAPVVDTMTGTSTAPTLAVAKNGSGQPVLTWTADSAALSYKVLRSTNGIAYTTISTVASSVHTYTDVSRPIGTVYYTIIGVH